MKTELHLDVTAWARGPTTSLGLCARRLESSLRRIASLETRFQIETWTRRRPQSADLVRLKQESGELLKRMNKLSWMQQYRGVGGVYHSTDPILPRMKSSKRIMTVHDCWTLNSNPYQSPDFQRFQKRRFESALGRADYVIVPSQHVADQLLEHKTDLRGRVSIIPWGPLLGEEISKAPVVKNQSSAASVVQAYLAKGRSFFLCVANLEVRKNHEILFRAMAELPQVDLVLVGGEGYGWEEIEKRRQELCATTPCFWFKDVSSADIASLYESSLAVVLPSLDEGFGLPACEALMFSKPLVLSKIAPFFEIAGSAGLYFDPLQGLDDLKEILSKLVEDAGLREAWATKAKQRQHLFSWELTARSHLALYRRL